MQVEDEERNKFVAVVVDGKVIEYGAMKKRSVRTKRQQDCHGFLLAALRRPYYTLRD